MTTKIPKIIKKLMYVIFRVVRVFILLYLVVFVLTATAIRYNGQQFPFDYRQGPDTSFAQKILMRHLPKIDPSKVHNLYAYRFTWTDEIVNVRFNYYDDSALEGLLEGYQKSLDSMPPSESKDWEKIPGSKASEQYERILDGFLEREQIWIDRNTQTVWYEYVNG